MLILMNSTSVLNTLWNDEAATSNMVFKISRLSQRIQFDTRQRNTQR